MKELWEQATLPYNLPLTVLLGLVAVFWVLSILGTVDLDSIDFDLDADMDTDAEGASGSVSEGALGFMFRFVNAQDIPVMMVLSLLTLFMWVISIASNDYLNPNQSGWIAAGLFLVNFVMSAILVKVVTHPLRPLLSSLKNDKEHQEPLVGLSGTVKSRILDSNFGQVEVPRDKGAPALLNAILPEGREALVRGDKILVIDHDAARDKFLVQDAALKAED